MVAIYIAGDHSCILQEEKRISIARLAIFSPGCITVWSAYYRCCRTEKDSVLAAMHTAAAFVVNIPGYNRTATQSNVQVLHMTGQHGIHCFILSPHTFLLAISVHNVIAILLVVAVFPPN